MKLTIRHIGGHLETLNFNRETAIDLIAELDSAPADEFFQFEIGNDAPDESVAWIQKRNITRIDLDD